MRSLCLIAAVAALAACDPATGPKGVVVTPADGISLDSLTGRDSAGEGVGVDVAGADAVGDAKQGADADSGPVGGSRLKPVWLVAGDGTRERIDWFDSALGVRCGFAPVGGGDSRCLPSIADSRVIEGDGGQVAIRGTFTDPGCSNRVVPAGWHTCAPLVLRDDATVTEPIAPLGECGRPSSRPERHYRIAGAADVPDGATLYEWTATDTPTCVAAKDPAAGDYYRVGAEILHAELVRADVAVGD
jgi:hypothetical protein